VKRGVGGVSIKEGETSAWSQKLLGRGKGKTKSDQQREHEGRGGHRAETNKGRVFDMLPRGSCFAGKAFF